jgi:TRAP-type C4-dicarboxylate transport system substrate-binding protein
VARREHDPVASILQQALSATDGGAAVIRAALTVGTIVLLAAGCSGGGGKAGGHRHKAVVVLTLADHEKNDRDVGDFASAVERLSGGSMRIESKGGWRQNEIDYDRGTVADLRAGKVDLAKIGVRSFDTMGVRTFQPLMAPLLVDSLALEQKVLGGPLATRMLDGVRSLGVEGVAVLPGALRRPFGISRRLLSPLDYQGATIGIRPSLVSSWTFETLGATTPGYVPGKLTRSLDGAELDLTTLQGNQYDFAGSALTANVALWPRAFALVANRRLFERLTPRQRSILRKAGRDALRPAFERVRDDEVDNAGILCRRGRVHLVDASSAQLHALRVALGVVYARLEKDPATHAAIDQIERMKRRVAPDRPRSCGARAMPAATGSPLDGVYEVDTSREDGVAAGAPSDERVPENFGHWVYVLDHGRLAFTQEDSAACTWAYGKVTFQGHTLSWTILDGGYTRSPNLAYDKPGESFRFGWSLYRDTLTLSPVNGAISPANFRAKPWHRVSSTPSRSYFSKDCPPPKRALP